LEVFSFDFRAAETSTAVIGLKIDERAAVSFPDWKKILEKTELSAELQRAWAQEVFSFLRFCKEKRAPASVMLPKLYIEKREAQAKKRDEGCRWLCVGSSRRGKI